MGLKSVALLAHLAGVVVWVGGMFFAYLCLRPAVAEIEHAEVRLKLWLAVFQRFFRFVAASVALILCSGFYLMFGSGPGPYPLHWHLMLGIGCVMAAIFVQIAVGPFRRLGMAVTEQQWRDGAAALAGIRLRVAVNLSLGFLTVAIATVGPWVLD